MKRIILILLINFSFLTAYASPLNLADAEGTASNGGIHFEFKTPSGPNAFIGPHAHTGADGHFSPAPSSAPGPVPLPAGHPGAGVYP